MLGRNELTTDSSGRVVAKATVDTLAADLAAQSAAAGLREVGPDYDAELKAWLLSRQPELVTDENWQLIDAYERSTGQAHGRPRVKLTSIADMLRIGHG